MHDDDTHHDPAKRTRVRQARHGANLARHLNGRYPDTALFLARHGAGRPDAHSARIVTVDSEEVVLTVEDPSGSHTVTVALPPNPEEADGGDARMRLRQFLAWIRVNLPASADVPMTSLETMLAAKPGAAEQTGEPRELHARMAALHARRSGRDQSSEGH